eukprot:2743447-Alexandrium_andersonii.AAC.1
MWWILTVVCEIPAESLESDWRGLELRRMALHIGGLFAADGQRLLAIGVGGLSLIHISEPTRLALI